MFIVDIRLGICIRGEQCCEIQTSLINLFRIVIITILSLKKHSIWNTYLEDDENKYEMSTVIFWNKFSLIAHIDFHVVQIIKTSHEHMNVDFY